MQDKEYPVLTIQKHDPKALVEARLQAHWAARLLAAAGETLKEKLPDDSQSALVWNEDRASLELPGLPDGRLLFLRLPGLQVTLTKAGAVEDEGREQHGLAGFSFPEALAGLSNSLGQPLTPPGHELPEHGVATGAKFATEPASAFEALSAWYALAYAALRPVAEARAEASPLNIWPHHFDLATLLSLPGEPGRSVGVGFSPGDGSYAQPYFYVTPWPYPEASVELQALPGGHWHREGWTGAVLTAEELLAGEEGLLNHFLETAVSACLAALG